MQCTLQKMYEDTITKTTSYLHINNAQIKHNFKQRAKVVKPSYQAVKNCNLTSIVHA